jgi:hypothetical protein
MTTGGPLMARLQPERYTLLGTHCENCKGDYFPQTHLCPKCRRKGKLSAKLMPRTGKIYSWSKLTSGPKGFESQTPYFLGMVELDNGVKLLTQIVDSTDDAVTIGAPVEMMFRRVQSGEHDDAIAYGYKFRVKPK